MKLLKEFPGCILKNRCLQNFSELKSKAFCGAPLQLNSQTVNFYFLLKYHGSRYVFICFLKQLSFRDPAGCNLNKCRYIIKEIELY